MKALAEARKRAWGFFKFGSMAVLALALYAPMVSAQTCAPPPSGLVSWWPGQGNANDNLGVNNGILEGGVTFAPGEVGQAFNFDGTNGTVFVPDSSSLRLTSQMTIEAWINTRSTNLSSQSIVAKVGGPTGDACVAFALPAPDSIWRNPRCSPGSA